MVSAKRSRGFVRLAAGAARRATGGHLALGALLDLERVAAATRRGHVRVVDGEPALEALDEVDLRALQVRSAERVDDNRDAERVDLVVALLGAGIEAERVLEARAASALNRDAQDIGLAGRLLGHQLADLRGGACGEADQRFLLDCCHLAHRSNVFRRYLTLLSSARRTGLCNSRYPHR